MSNDTGGSWEVGYKKPPKHTRFKKGQSGNPAGRPKGKVTTADAVEVFFDVMDTPVAINENGKARKITLLRAFFLSEMKKALKGDAQSGKLIAAMLLKWPSRPNREQLSSRFSTADAVRDFDALLDDMAARFETRPADNDQGSGQDRKAS